MTTTIMRPPPPHGYMTPSSSYMHNKNILAVKHKSLGLCLRSLGAVHKLYNALQNDTEL